MYHLTQSEQDLANIVAYLLASGS